MSEYKSVSDGRLESVNEIQGSTASVIIIADSDGNATTGITIAQAIATGIAISATTTTAANLSGTATTGIAISGTKTTGISITSTSTTGLSIAGTTTTGIELSGTKTNAISFASCLASTNTDGTLMSTGSTWIDHATAGQCAIKFLCSTSATSGDYATLRIRAKSLGVTTTGGVVGGNFSASGAVNDYGNLYAVQGYAQPNTFTQSNASNIICGVYSCVDRTVSSSGRSWSMWTDTHETVKASGGHYLHRLSHNGGEINLDGIWTIYAGQGCDYLMTFENTNAPVASGDKTGGTKSYSLAVNVNGAVRYIQLYDAA